jgi:hypothetical protein
MKKTAVAVVMIMAVMAMCACQAWAYEEGPSNTFYGLNAGLLNSGANNNSFFGAAAGYYTVSGTANSFFGIHAGLNNTSSMNVFIGAYAGTSNITGQNNTYVGNESGFFATGSENAALGSGAGYNVLGSGNVFIGYNAGYSWTGSNRLFIDNCFTASGCTDPLIYGEFDNRVVGISGLLVTTDGIRFHDGTTQTTAMTGVTGASNHNAFLGINAGAVNSTGEANTFIGHSAGNTNSTGSYNTMLGFYAGDGSDPADSNNTYVGALAGYKGTGNVMIGYKAGFNETRSNILYIANSETTTPLIYGEFDNKIVKINGKLVFASDERLKKNIEPLKSSLDKVMHLNGVSYEWKSEENQGKGREIGLIAQEVETLIPELVVTDSNGYKAMSYDKMVPVLVEAIKEQQVLIKGLKGEMAKLSAEVNRLKSKDMSAQK